MQGIGNSSRAVLNLAVFLYGLDWTEEYAQMLNGPCMHLQAQRFSLA